METSEIVGPGCRTGPRSGKSSATSAPSRSPTTVARSRSASGTYFLAIHAKSLFTIRGIFGRRPYLAVAKLPRIMKLDLVPQKQPEAQRAGLNAPASHAPSEPTTALNLSPPTLGISYFVLLFVLGYFVLRASLRAWVFRTSCFSSTVFRASDFPSCLVTASGKRPLRGMLRNRPWHSRRTHNHQIHSHARKAR